MAVTNSYTHIVYLKTTWYSTHFLELAPRFLNLTSWCHSTESYQWLLRGKINWIIEILSACSYICTVMELHLHHFHKGVGLISFSTGSMILIALTTLHMRVFTIDFYMCTLHSSLDHPCVNKFSRSLSIQWRLTFVLYWKQTLINSLYCLSSKSDCTPLRNLCLCWNCHTTVFFFIDSLVKNSLDFHSYTCTWKFKVLQNHKQWNSHQR